ncbi:MAG: GTP-binding protein [Candidatus Thermoplasmatota archaeon]|jgi:LAO/AO transport system kinase|nr:ATP/GTP-binding protein [Candidatus Thalassarchaeaceae archaeon]MEC7104708.1 GTP-binding protein [Candidatus Thermoplasmatota archaeon]MEC7364506.1 GTP-binding protein [Candidatus Thermoplasmatota archaeon]MEC7458925.1 GTP-binding protein [Candidatus Thermoplasmatota archaeon]|tara:strand:- start:12205 stop:13089 length:885 start_codon:yes stop_codon:yes gene_type:complete
MTDISDLFESAKLGDRRSLSMLISAISESGDHPSINSATSWILGVTGPPGSGKSTLIGQMVRTWASSGERVAVLALDPTSPLSGGSLLADRIRMEGDDLRENVFVRSIPSGNTPGAISPFLWPICSVLSECGWTRIIVETVGTGQSEFRIAALVDRLLLVDGPDRGDIIQAEKAGILELADVIAVNKSDLPAASSAAQHIRSSLNLASDDNREVVLVSAKEGNGIQELVEIIERCEPQNTRGRMMMRERLLSEWDSILVSHPEIDNIVSELCDGSITLREAIEALVSSIRDGGS